MRGSSGSPKQPLRQLPYSRLNNKWRKETSGTRPDAIPCIPFGECLQIFEVLQFRKRAMPENSRPTPRHRLYRTHTPQPGRQSPEPRFKHSSNQFANLFFGNLPIDGFHFSPFRSHEALIKNILVPLGNLNLVRLGGNLFPQRLKHCQFIRQWHLADLGSGDHQPQLKQHRARDNFNFLTKHGLTIHWGFRKNPNLVVMVFNLEPRAFGLPPAPRATQDTPSKP